MPSEPRTTPDTDVALLTRKRLHRRPVSGTDQFGWEAGSGGLGGWRACPETTTVHLLRHGEVHNPDRVLYGRLPGFHLSDLGRRQAGRRRAVARRARRRLPRRVPAGARPGDRRPARRALPGSPIDTDQRLIEAANELEGRRVAGGKGLFTDVRNWKHFRNPLRPSWGEPYREIADRMLAAARSARDQVAGTGRDAVCVSHQLPIVVRAARPPRDCGCSTTRGGGSARSRRSRPSPSTGT